ncbi:class III lanthipeptide [Rummeliibacillus stabekisii]|nr:class III lanthipeptide [Rummeliibacillus stabekisii]
MKEVLALQKLQEDSAVVEPLSTPTFTITTTTLVFASTISNHCDHAS